MEEGDGVINWRRLEYEALRRGLTLAELARKVGMSERGLRRWREEGHRPKRKSVELVARCLMETPIIKGTELFLGEPPPRRRQAAAS